jgi:hypothetical protein
MDKFCPGNQYDETRRIWSLWDIMKKYDVGGLSLILGGISGLETMLSAKRKISGDTALGNDFRKELTAHIGESTAKVEVITFLDCASILGSASAIISQEGTTLGMAEVALINANESIVKELYKWGFVPVHPEVAKYFEQATLFGREVSDAFPDAGRDIKDSGNCIAVELSTAAVFHLMRVAEHGLRMLAKKLRVKLTHSGHHHPIEYADWEKVITGVKNKIAKTRPLPQGSKRQEQLEMYSDAADHCVFMKDIWRNNVSHARKPYTNAEAIGVFERVRDFMKFIATNLV